MKRNPKKEYIKRYMESIKIRKIFPLLLWYKCDRCGMEYVREPMWICSAVVSPRVDLMVTHYGCTHCFHSKERFKNWLQEVNLLKTEEDLDYLYENEFL